MELSILLIKTAIPLRIIMKLLIPLMKLVILSKKKVKSSISFYVISNPIYELAIPSQNMVEYEIDDSITKYDGINDSIFELIIASKK